jgi:SCY1-like protein 2
MFSKLKGSTGVSGNYPTPLDLNPIAQYFEIGKQVASAGPELAWKIFDAQRKSDKKVCAIVLPNLYAFLYILINCFWLIINIAMVGN